MAIVIEAQAKDARMHGVFHRPQGVGGIQILGLDLADVFGGRMEKIGIAEIEDPAIDQSQPDKIPRPELFGRLLVHQGFLAATRYWPPSGSHASALSIACTTGDAV